MSLRRPASSFLTSPATPSSGFLAMWKWSKTTLAAGFLSCAASAWPEPVSQATASTPDSHPSPTKSQNSYTTAFFLPCASQSTWPVSRSMITVA